VRLIETSGGQIEVVTTGVGHRAVLYFHGGHESAATAAAAGLYQDIGYRVVLLSRSGMA
jgi:hypothetical protein